MKQTYILCQSIVALALLGACVSKPPVIEEHDLFITHIKPNGSKLFSFSIVIHPNHAQSHARGQRSDGMGPPQGKLSADKAHNSAQDNFALLHERLDGKLFKTNYCRNGYIEVDTYESEQRAHLLGECNESATQQDIETFANNYYGD